MPPVDESHQILLSALEALRATRTTDCSAQVLYNGGEPLSGRMAGVSPTAAYVSPQGADQVGVAALRRDKSTNRKRG
jgi:hypothetical protein